MQNDRSGVLGRLADVLSRTMSTGQIAIDRMLSVNIGDPSMNRDVDIVTKRGTDPFIQSEIPGASEKGQRTNLIDIMQKLNRHHESGISSFHSELWSQSFIDSQTLTEEYRSVLVSSAASVRPLPFITFCLTRFGLD